MNSSFFEHTHVRSNQFERPAHYWSDKNIHLWLSMCGWGWLESGQALFSAWYWQGIQFSITYQIRKRKLYSQDKIALLTAGKNHVTYAFRRNVRIMATRSNSALKAAVFMITYSGWIEEMIQTEIRKRGPAVFLWMRLNANEGAPSFRWMKDQNL